MQFLLESYGCTLNKGESRELAALLEREGHTIIHSLNGASAEESPPPVPDGVIIFTCGVIQTTEQKMLKRIRELARQVHNILVCGCLGPICESGILKAAPGAVIFPPASNQDIVKHISNLTSEPTVTPSQISMGIEDRIGILPIATGCMGKCTYCITRKARGPLVSRGLDGLLERAATLIHNGTVELQGTSQDTAVYGLDIGESPRLPDLLPCPRRK